MTLKRLYESHFDFRYEDMDSTPFKSGNWHQWRDVTLNHFPQPMTVIEAAIYKGMIPSKSEAKRLLKGGAIRLGLADENTGLKSCKKLTQDRPLEPNDLIRIGLKGLWIRPNRPTLMDELQYAWERLRERIRMPIALATLTAVTFLLAGCLNVPPATQKLQRNKPHEGMSFRADGWENR